MNTILKNTIEKNQKLINDTLNKLITPNGNILTDAIRYSLLQNSKRLRSLFIIETIKLFKKPDQNTIIIASAIEMIHIFSLIHDDLPAMDNDDYRRGQLTCHKKWKEYNAILAGDSLILLAIQTIIEKTSISFTKKNKIILSIKK